MLRGIDVDEYILVVADPKPEKWPKCLFDIVGQGNTMVLAEGKGMITMIREFQFGVIVLAAKDADVCTNLVEELMRSSLASRYQGRVLCLANDNPWWMRESVYAYDIGLHPNGARLDGSVAALIEKNRKR